MPIEDIHFEKEIVFSRATGQIERADADKWLIAVQRCLEMKRRPIIAVMDALDATFISISARVVFAQTSRNTNLLGLVVAANSIIAVQSFRITGMLGERGHTTIFPTLDEARRFAENRLQNMPTG